MNKKQSECMVFARNLYSVSDVNLMKQCINVFSAYRMLKEPLDLERFFYGVTVMAVVERLDLNKAYGMQALEARAILWMMASSALKVITRDGKHLTADGLEDGFMEGIANIISRNFGTERITTVDGVDVKDLTNVQRNVYLMKTAFIRGFNVYAKQYRENALSIDTHCFGKDGAELEHDFVAPAQGGDGINHYRGYNETKVLMAHYHMTKEQAERAVSIFHTKRREHKMTARDRAFLSNMRSVYNIPSNIGDAYIKRLNKANRQRKWREAVKAKKALEAQQQWTV